MPLLGIVALSVKVLKVVVLVVVVLALAVGGFLLWAAGGESAEEAAARREVPPEVVAPSAPEAPALEGPLVVLSWNIAYGRGPKDDAGDLRDRETVVGYLERVADAIERSGAHVAALQEVDFDAARTHGIDQVRFLAERLGWRYAARVVTWKNRWVPYPYWPPTQHYGPMLSGQAVLSRYPIERNVRVRYPQPASWAFWYRAFYLHRATQIVDVRVGERVVTLLNTHLEAFDEPNRELQAARLVELCAEERRPTLVVLGDMNATPPEATRKSGFADEPEADFETDGTIRLLREGAGLAEVIPAAVYRADEARAFTFPADAPSRRLDYLFFGEGLRLREGGVYAEAGPQSDHLPVRAVFDWAP